MIIDSNTGINLEKNQTNSGFRYLTKGLGIMMQPGMKRFIFIPIITNCIIFVLLTLYLLNNFSVIQNGLTEAFADYEWLAFIAAFLSGLLIFFTLVIYGYSFTILTNIIAAPFYGVLAEKVEERITGQSFSQEPLIALIGRTLKREMIKLWYFVSRGILVAIGLFILGFIPLVNLLVPIIALLWATWVMSLQFIDYPADNHQLPFPALRQRLKHQRWSSIGFGGTIMLCSMVPVLNIIVMPISVAGGTLFWINELRQDALET